MRQRRGGGTYVESLPEAVDPLLERRVEVACHQESRRAEAGNPGLVAAEVRPEDQASGSMRLALLLRMNL